MRVVLLILILWPLSAAAGLLDILPLGWLEKRMLYHFSPLEESPQSAGLRGVTVQKLPVKNATLVAWTAPPLRPGGPVVMYLHGNAGNLAIRAHRFQRFMDQGYGFVAPGYRGSSGSTGQPSETALIDDALHVYRKIPDWVATSGKVILYGESLGTAVASGVMAELAPSERPAGVILEAPFTSIPDMARAVTDVPPNLIARIKDKWDTLGRAPALSVPLLVIHGTLDPVVPYAMGRRVFAAAATREKDFVSVTGAAHSDTWRPNVRRRMWRFVSSYGR